MILSGEKVVVVGGAGLIGSHTIDQLCRTDVGEIVIYDNFVRGKLDNLAVAYGRLTAAQDAAEAIRRGAWAVVVGTAITHPATITSWFADAVASVSSAG